MKVRFQTPFPSLSPTSRERRAPACPAIASSCKAASQRRTASTYLKILPPSLTLVSHWPCMAENGPSEHSRAPTRCIPRCIRVVPRYLSPPPVVGDEAAEHPASSFQLLILGARSKAPTTDLRWWWVVVVVKLFQPHPPVARNNRLPAGAGNAPESRPFPSSTAAGTGQTHQLPSSMDSPSPSLSLSGRTTPTPPPAPRPPFREGKRKRGPPDWNLPLSWRVMWPIRGAAREN